MSRTRLVRHVRRMSGIAASMVLVFLLVIAPAWSVDTPQARANLKGIKGLVVNVEPLEPEIENGGLTTDQIRTDVEVRLRQSGINVIPPLLLRRSLQSGSPFPPMLWVVLRVVRHEPSRVPVYAFSVNVELLQVRLSQDMEISAVAPTWKFGLNGVIDSGPFPDLRSHVRDAVDQFINAYLEQNPKQ